MTFRLARNGRPVEIDPARVVSVEEVASKG